jgi:hypothetical protein
MRFELFPSPTNSRFHSAFISTIVQRLWIADEMTQDIASTSPEDGTDTSVRAHPRARDYFWRPWYAKLWWVSIPIYWLILGGFGGFQLIDAQIGSWPIAILNVVFLPITAGLFLGFGFFSRLLHAGNDQPDADDTWRYHDPANPAGFQGPMAYLSDPTDIRSPLNTLNPANPHYLHRH